MFVQFLINSLIAGSAYALIGLSFNLIYTPTRFFHIAHGAVFTWGAYLGYTGYVLLGWPLLITIPLAIGMVAGLGVGLELGIYRPLRQRETTRLVSLLASLGLYVLLQNLISMLFGDVTKSMRSGIVVESITFHGAHITPIQIWIILVSAGFFVLIWVFLKYTMFGKALRAVASDQELALIHGVDTNRIILRTFAVGSGLAGLAALLIAMDVDMTPTMGLNALIMGIVAMIIGGIGSVPGTWLGGLLLGLAQQFGGWKIGTEWQDAIAFVILVVFLLVRPYGILGRTSKKVEV